MTVTLDDDVAANVRAHMRKRGVSFKDAVNDLIRLGFLYENKAEATREPFVVHARPLGVPDFESVEEVLDRLDDPERGW